MQPTRFHYRRLYRTLIALSTLALIVPGLAQAAFIDFTGQVTEGGNFLGDPRLPSPFAVGNQLNGVFELDDAAVAPSASFGPSELVSTDFAVGQATFNLADFSPFIFFNGPGRIADDGTSLSLLDAGTLSSGEYVNCSGCSLVLAIDDDSTGSFTVNVPGSSTGNGGFVRGDLRANVRSTVDVPEPGVPALFAFGLGLLRLSKRRRTG